MPPAANVFAPFTLLASLQGIERDVVHFVTCRLYAPWLDPVLLTLQEKEVAIPLVVAAVGIVAIGRGRRRGLRALLACAAGFGLAMALATVLWATIDRARPSQAYAHLLRTPAEQAACAERPDALALRKDPARSPSFPSRHALSAGVFAAVLWAAWRGLGAVAVVYAVLVAVGRVYAGKHWPSDVIAGLLFGAVLGALVWRLLPWLLDRARLGRLVRGGAPAGEVPAG